MEQSIYEFSLELDVLGKPDDWIDVNKKLNPYLPLIREVIHSGKGVIQSIIQ